MPSPTPAGGYTFPWAFQICHICHKRTATWVQGAHKARPSSEGALQAPACSSSFSNCPAASLTCCLVLAQQELRRSTRWESAERDSWGHHSVSPTLLAADGCSIHTYSHLQSPAGSCLSPKGLNMIQEPTPEKFSHTLNHLGGKFSNH